MPLNYNSPNLQDSVFLDQKTDFTTLKYGMDQPQGGNSGLPYVKFPMQDAGPVTNSILQFYQRNRNSLDYPIRGGSELDPGTGTARRTLTGEIDQLRISKFLKDGSRGPAFLKKQVELQKTNPRMETTQGYQSTSFGSIPNTWIYDPSGKNLLNAVLTSGTGYRPDRIGINGFQFQNFYAATIQKQFTTVNGKARNRLLAFYQTKMFNSNREVVFSDPNLYNTLGMSLNKSILFDYIQGPGSTYGVGKTIVRRTSDTTLVSNILTLTYDQIKKQQTNGTNSLFQNVSNIQDFRSKVASPVQQARAWNFEKQSIQNRMNAGNPGDPRISRLNPNFPFVSYVRGTDVGIDRLNALSPFTVNEGDSPFDNQYAKDIIKFAFEAISNDNPTKTTALVFRAFLSGISDNHAAEYNTFKYLGRGENFRTYQGFDRTVNFSFKIFAQSRAELKPMYEKLNNLTSQVYPDYSSQTSAMRAPIIKLTIGDYLYRTPGVLESVNITIEDDAAWEINQENEAYSGRKVAELPQYLNVSISFKPIMDILPRRAQDLKDTPALLANGNFIVDTLQKQEADAFKTEEQRKRQAAIDETSRLQRESNRLQNETRNLINERAATTELLSGLEESGFFNNNTRRI
jgi:hypothetical protein